MGSYDVDFDGYDDSKGGGYSGPTPVKGIYDGVLISLKDHTSSGGNEGLEWIFEITEGDFTGWRGWVYSNMDSAKWRTQEIVKAISGGSEKATKIKTTDDGTDSPTVKKAKRVRLALRTTMYDDEKQAKIRNVLPYEEVEGGGGKKKKKKKSGDEPSF